MHPIIIIFQIFAGIFSILGIYEFLRKVFDRYVINRSQAACKILIYKSGPDAEYSLRFLESRFAYGEYADLFDGIIIAEETQVPEEVIVKLNSGYANIVKEQTTDFSEN